MTGGNLLVFRARRFATVLLFVDVALLVLHLVASVLKFHGADLVGRAFGGVDLVNLDAEVSIPTWWQQLLLAGAAALAALNADQLRRTDGPMYRYWFGLAGILAFISIDEGSEIHERLIAPMREAFGITGGVLWFAWLIPGLVLLAAFLIVYFRFWWQLPSRPRLALAAAGVLYVAGAAGVEMVGGAYESANGQDLGYSMIIAAEEGLEMLGATILVFGLLLHLSTCLSGRPLAVRVDES